ncbi:hypothetical protein [Leptospira mayottensis]|uniref:hypothetical protein n=1 Tax=Leptospira mayottensis TaxID=1137606 RepID=UPI000E35DBF7|nr:hypothetical protein [Leptospira mayottensis]AXR66853.1 hypothetical protein DPV73_01220 [Leptospira mayottensis]AXR66871.1 hypothetical protein DPV73_01335 [Leptospira mayottensis]
MIRTRITPQNTDLYLSIPEMYVGKNIEVLFYAVDEIKEEPKKSVTMKDFKGILSKESAAKLQEKIQKEREEWN